MNIEFGQFEKHIFTIFDTGTVRLFVSLKDVFYRNVIITNNSDDTGMINFSEFVCGLWNFLSLPESDIAGIVYCMKDPTGKLVVRCTHTILSTINNVFLMNNSILQLNKW